MIYIASTHVSVAKQSISDKFDKTIVSKSLNGSYARTT